MTDRLDHLVRDQALGTPEAVAVCGPQGKLTYAELLSAADTAATRLRALGAGPDTVVAIRAKRSTDLVAALLGILSAGAAYLPLDPDTPPLRLAHMLEEAQVRIVIADDPAGIPSHVEALTLRKLTSETSAQTVQDRPADPAGTDLAYVIYTSGSTGRPKGVAIEHRSVVRRLEWMQRTYPLSPDDAVLQKTPYTFDVSVWELFWPLLAGARLVLAEPGRHTDPEYLAYIIARQAVTTAHFVPSMLAVFVDEPGLTDCRSLRRVFCSGELLPAAVANRFTRLHPAELHNLYGPTEASIEVTFWPCRSVEPGDAVPIGYPMPHVDAHVLDKHHRPVPDGTKGELYLGGVCLARGYIGRPDLTAERFITIPDLAGGQRLYRTGDVVSRAADGRLDFHGRVDHQVKLRGFRIELGEIESALREHPRVQDAAVVLRNDLGSAPRLAAYVITGQGGQALPDRAALAAHLRERLPDYMVPTFLTVLDRPPTTANGKLDRTSLPRPDRRTARL